MSPMHCGKSFANGKCRRSFRTSAKHGDVRRGCSGSGGQPTRALQEHPLGRTAAGWTDAQGVQEENGADLFSSDRLSENLHGRRLLCQGCIANKRAGFFLVSWLSK